MALSRVDEVPVVSCKAVSCPHALQYNLLEKSTTIALNSQDAMYHSKKKKMLFVHIQKTGGSSLINIFKEHIHDLHTVAGKHDHARWVQPKLARQWSDLFKFAFVRNPWERLVSWYSMIQERAARGDKMTYLWTYVLNQASTFDEFIWNCTEIVNDKDGLKSFWFNQLDYVTDKDGNLIVDFIGRYENFAQNAQYILDKLQLPNIKLPHTNKSSHHHYSHYYTDATRDVVAERYARDIKFWGYRFEQR
jgi:hypothetical protein